MAKFVVGNETFTIPVEKLPEGGYLRSAYTYKSSTPERINDLKADQFRPVYDYLVNGIIPKVESIGVFHSLGIPFIHSYSLACVMEDDMRKNMYVSSSDKYLSLHYGLEQITKSLWENPTRSYNEPKGNNFLFKNSVVKKQSWSDITKRLKELDYIFELHNVFIAGGAIYSILFGLPINDIDLFFYDTTPDQAEKKIHQLAKILEKKLPKNKFDSVDVIRTANAVTFYCGRNEVQVILRLYQTPSEIIHGFDVDCCSLGYDGDSLWMTHRAWFALENGYNTVNFDRLSPSYEYRLAKYGSRGMAIYVPYFKRDRIDSRKIESDLKEYYPVSTRKSKPLSMGGKFNHIKNAKGLDILLYLEAYAEHYNYKSTSMQPLGALADEKSDYAPGMFYKMKYCYSRIGDIVDYLVESADDHPEYSEKYMRYFKPLYGKPLGVIYINNVPRCKKINFIKCRINSLEEILHIREDYYNGLNVVRPWDFDKDLVWKVTNPGEQMTGTFHKTVLEDNKIWYEGKYYDTLSSASLDSKSSNGGSSNKELKDEGRRSITKRIESEEKDLIKAAAVAVKHYEQSRSLHKQSMSSEEMRIREEMRIGKMESDAAKAHSTVKFVEQPVTGHRHKTTYRPDPVPINVVVNNKTTFKSTPSTPTLIPASTKMDYYFIKVSKQGIERTTRYMSVPSVVSNLHSLSDTDKIITFQGIINSNDGWSSRDDIRAIPSDPSGTTVCYQDGKITMK